MSASSAPLSAQGLSALEAPPSGGASSGGSSGARDFARYLVRKLAAALLSFAVLLVVGFTIFAVLNRSYSAPYGTAAGELVLAFVAALYAGGLIWLNHLGSVPVPGRFLAEQPSDQRAGGRR